MSDVAVTGPVYRVRISHAHTLKDGWRCDSTTVEATFRPEDYDVRVRDGIRGLLQEAFDLAEIEAAQRNGLPLPPKEDETSAEEPDSVPATVDDVPF